MRLRDEGLLSVVDVVRMDSLMAGLCVMGLFCKRKRLIYLRVSGMRWEGFERTVVDVLDIHMLAVAILSPTRFLTFRVNSCYNFIFKKLQQKC